MRRHLHLREGLVKAVRKKVHRNGLNHSLYEGCEPFFRSILLYGVVWVAEVAHGIKSLAAARKIVLSRMKNHSQPNDFSFGAENSGVFRGVWDVRQMGPFFKKVVSFRHAQ